MPFISLWRQLFATSSLLTDPKSRKIIIVEHALLPVYVKEILAKVLFENLQVPPSITLHFPISHFSRFHQYHLLPATYLPCSPLAE